MQERGRGIHSTTEELVAALRSPPVGIPPSCNFLKGFDVMSFVWCLVCA